MTEGAAMNSIDNLREYVLTAPSICSTTRAILVGYIDGIEREVADNERFRAEAEPFADRLREAVGERADVTIFGVDYMACPLDADGVPIHAGDFLDGYGKTIEVVELRYGRSGWVLISRDGNGYADCAAFAHHHAPTVEDVLRELVRYAYECAIHSSHATCDDCRRMNGYCILERRMSELGVEV